MGTSPFDTFALLVPEDRDEEAVESDDPEEMVDIASEHTAAEHPPILSLQPLENSEGDFPRLSHDEEEDWYFLTIELPATAEGKPTKMTLNLVFEGVGEL